VKRAYPLLLVTVCMTLMPCIKAQVVNPIALQSASTDPKDTVEGLRLFLEDALQAARNHDSKKLSLDISQTAIPHYADFFRKTWPGPGESWVGGYATDLSENQGHFKSLLTYLSQVDGELVIRSVNQNPEGGRGMEWGMLDSLAIPLDIYYAGWKVAPKSPDDQHTLPIGYFFFVDGGFRWDSTVQFVTKVVHSTTPIYPYPVSDDSPKGTVSLIFTLNSNGTVSRESIQVAHRPGTTDDPKLIQAAKDAVVQYQYMPPDLFKIKMGNMMETVGVPPSAKETLAPPKIVFIPSPPNK